MLNIHWVALELTVVNKRQAIHTEVAIFVMSATRCFKLVFSVEIPFQFFKLMLKFLA